MRPKRQPTTHNDRILDPGPVEDLGSGTTRSETREPHGEPRIPVALVRHLDQDYALGFDDQTPVFTSRSKPPDWVLPDRWTRSTSILTSSCRRRLGDWMVENRGQSSDGAAGQWSSSSIAIVFIGAFFGLVLLPGIATAGPLPNQPCEECGNAYYVVTEVPATGEPGLNPSNLAAPIVGVSNPAFGETTEVGADGGVFVSGGAPFFGSLPGLHIKPGAPIVGTVAMGCCGYWLVGADGGVFAFGEAGFYGSLPGLHIKPSSPIVGMAVTNDLSGYWLVGADGGVYSFGDARFLGSLPGLGKRPAGAIVGMATAGFDGYLLVGSDGGVFAFGDAPSVSLGDDDPQLAPGGVAVGLLKDRTHQRGDHGPRRLRYPRGEVRHEMGATSLP